MSNLPPGHGNSWMESPEVGRSDLIERAANIVDSAIMQIKRLMEKLVDSRNEVDALKFEVEVLRLYGNKDCTAQADERIKSGEPIE